MTSGSQTLLDMWKNRAQAKRNWLSQVLSRPAASPGQGMRRQQFLQRTANALENRKQWATAYHEHVAQLQQILTGSTVSATAQSAGSSGELGES